jgi:hypothetical protein
MVVVMLKQVGKVVVAVVAVDNMVVLDKVPVPVMVKLVGMDLMVVDMLRLVVKAAAVGKVVQAEVDMETAQEVVLDQPEVVADIHKS